MYSDQGYSRVGAGPRIFGLTLLVIVLAVGGALWFDFLGLVEAGNLDGAVAWLAKRPENRLPFLAAWKGSALSQRMALLLAAEQALEGDGAFFDAIVGGLIELLETEDTALKGDTIDLLGQIGHPDAREPLESLRKDEDPDIVDVAEEALENLRSPP